MACTAPPLSLSLGGERAQSPELYHLSLCRKLLPTWSIYAGLLDKIKMIKM